MWDHIFYGQIATLIIILAYFPYIISILKNRAEPDKTTWLVFSLMGIITFIAYREVGAHATLGVALANIVGPFIVFLLSLKFSNWNDKNDFKYLIFSLIAIVLWKVFDSPLLGLTFNLLADFIAFIPTIVKSFLAPKTEDFLAWGLFTIGNIVSLFAIEQWSFSIAIYPLYLLITEGIVVLLLLTSYFNKSNINLLQKK